MLFLILFLLLSIPAVQTRLGKYATKKLNEDFGTNINIEKVGLQLNGDVELMNIYIEDYKKDTLINILELNTSILSFKKLYDNKLAFGDIDVEGLLLNIKTYHGETDTNLDIFVAKFDDDKPRKDKSDFLLSSSDVSIENSEFRLSDENKGEGAILKFTELNINATNFVIRGPVVNARINKMSFLDERGLRLKSMSSNFEYTLNDMTFEDLKMATANSKLNGELKFEYEREDLQHFVDSVNVKATFKQSIIDLDDLNIFYNEFGHNQIVTFDGNLSGTLNDLHADKLLLKAPGKTVVNGDINFKNLFNKEEQNFEMHGQFRELSSTYNDLKNLLPNVLGNSIPSILDKLGNFTIQGNSLVTSTFIEADIDIMTGLGLIYADLELLKIDNIDNAMYKGHIVMDEFKIGTLLNEPNLGATSLNLNVDGKGFTLDRLNTFVKGDIYGLNYNNYYYSNIKVAGNVQNKIFNGKLNTTDNNIDLDFNGLVDFSKKELNYDFVADINYANLNALKFVTRDSISVFKGVLDMKMKGSSVDNAYGNITFKNTLYTNQDDDYYFKDFLITSVFENDIRIISINSPDIIEGELRGNFVFNDIAKLFENSVGNIYTNYQPYEIADDQFIDFNFKIYNKIAEVFIPELNLGSNTNIRGRVESNARKFNLTFKSPEINLSDNFLRDIQIKIDNNNPLFNTLVEIDSVKSKFYSISDFSLINVTKNDTLFVKTEFAGGKTNRDAFDLNLFYTINEANKSVVGFKRSDVIFKGNTWQINQKNDSKNKIVLDRSFKDIVLNDLIMRHENEEIFLSGFIQDDNNKNINLDFKDVDLTKVMPEIEDLSLEGLVNGKLNILQKNNIYIPESNVVIDNFKVNENSLGSFKANIKGNESLSNYNVRISLKDDETESLLITGNLDVAGKNSDIDLNVKFDKFILDPLNPFGDGVITNIRGEVAGNAKVSGKLERPQISGLLSLNDAGMFIPYLNIDYELEDQTQVTLRNQSFNFSNATLSDSEYFSRATLSGNVSHVNFSNWALNLDLNSDRLLVLNTQDSEDALYYGTAFVDGNINIVGPTDQLVIKAEVTSEEGTVFKIPLNDTEAFGDSSFIHFLSPEEKIARLKGEVVQTNEIKGLEMDFDLTVNENAEIEIVIDKDSGSTIKGRGNGGLLAQINTNGKFNMYGDFIVTEGVYNFIYGGLIQKEFRVLSGGTLVWEGDPLQAQINIKAVYDKIQANPSILLDNPINRSIPVEVEIHLTGELEKPDPTFNLTFPSVNTTLNSELQYRLDDNESKQFQALSLLATGSFRSELSFDAQDAIGLFSDRASALLNEILASGDGKVQYRFDYKKGENSPEFTTDDRIDVTLSTQLSDRVLINGKVGVPIGGVNETVIAGNFEVEVLLNEDRTLSLKFFNRENSIQNFGEQIGYTQGVGVSYNVEFDNLNELFQKIFKGNTNAGKQKKKEKKKDENALPDFMNVKEKDSTSQEN
ncbi:MAG: translocation/assembly module TamB [Flavobacteriaceae bacterium]|nr:translocation/assembly module TamB [Flavobacteriaceae bacterium]